MSDSPRLSEEDMAKWAQSFGLTKLKPEHIARMTELSVYVADLCRNLPRAPRKEDVPVYTSALLLAECSLRQAPTKSSVGQSSDRSRR